MDADALAMIEGVLQVSEMQVGEIMIPRAQMDVIDISDPPESFIPFVIETAHSRFPGHRQGPMTSSASCWPRTCCATTPIRGSDIRDMLRPAVFIPESKRLNVLLQGIPRQPQPHRHRRRRIRRRRRAGDDRGRAGADRRRHRGRIRLRRDRRQHHPRKGRRASASRRGTEIADFNEALGTQFSDEEFDTVGGLVVCRFGHLPKRGESVEVRRFPVQILRADSRRLHAVRVTRLKPEEEDVQLPLV